MKRRGFAAICLAAALCALAGCQLAREDMQTAAYEDRLVGIFLTTEYLDLFDFDAYLQKNIGRLEGGTISIDGTDGKYQGRLYATRIARTLTNEETGEVGETDDYVFEGVEGIRFFCVTVPPEGEREGYWTFMSDPAISDGSTHLFYGDDEERVTAEGTLYVAPLGREIAYYFNPVYQSEDGSIYVVSGDGFMTGDWATSEGELYSQTHEATYTQSGGGTAKMQSTSVKIALSIMYAPKKIRVLQMDAEGSLISKADYVPGELPEMIAPEAGVAYLVVATEKTDEAGRTVTTRELYQRSDEALATFCAGEDGVCAKLDTAISW